jgi:hypothetical protein
MSSTTGRATDGKAVDILAELASLDATAIETDPKKRMEALVLSKKLTTLLEAPNDRAIDYIFKVRTIKPHFQRRTARLTMYSSSPSQA